MNKAEILRYMRMPSKTEDTQVTALIESCMAEIDERIIPKTVYRIYDLTVGRDFIKIEGFTFKSVRLAQNLKGCKRVCLFGATLGTECDRLLRIYSASDIARAAVMQAALASKIEEVCDSIENELKSTGMSLRQRYSPGYFDLDISEQTKIFALLDITKRIGITLTDTMQMIPTKSVTAFIGIE